MKFERIQVLRFIAAAVVVLYHAQATYLVYFPKQKIYWIINQGYVGVDLFFVISGFIIRYTIYRREEVWSIFIKRRIERIVPLYWTLTILFFAVSMAGLMHDQRPLHDRILLLVRSLGFVAWTTGPGVSPTVHVGWSLEYEILFYVVTAACLMISKRPSALVSILLSLPIILLRILNLHDGTAGHFFGNPIIVEFLFGMIIADVFVGETSYIAVAVTMICLVFVPFGDWGARVWLAGLPSTLLVSIAVLLDRRGPLPPMARWSVRFGDASYSIYLLQVLALSTICRIVLRVMPHLPLLPGAIVVTVLAIWISYLCYCLVERPITQLVHRLDMRRRGGVMRTASPVTDT